MISNDNFITIEMFNNGIQEIKSEIQQLNNELKTEIQKSSEQSHKELENAVTRINTAIEINTAKTESVHHSVNWGFALATIFIAIIGCFITLAPSILEYVKLRQKDTVTLEQVQEIVDKAVAKASIKEK